VGVEGAFDPGWRRKKRDLAWAGPSAVRPIGLKFIIYLYWQEKLGGMCNRTIPA